MHVSTYHSRGERTLTLEKVGEYLNKMAVLEY